MRRRSNRHPVAYAIAGVVLLGSIGAAFLAREREEAMDAYAFRRRSTPAVADVLGIVTDEVRGTAALAATVGARPVSHSELAGDAQMLFDRRGGSTVVLDVERRVTAADASDGGTRLPPPEDLRGRQLAAALDLARDTGLVEAATVAGDGAEAQAVLVAARYEASRVTGTALRRSALAGWVVRVVPLDAIVTERLSDALDDQAAFRIRDGDLVLAKGGRSAERGEYPSRADLVHRPVFAGRAWEIAVWPDAPLPLSWGLPGGLIAFGALAFFGIALLGNRYAGIRARAEASAEARGREVALIAQVGPVLQQSLDLAEVLPPVATALADELALEALSVAVADDAGRLREVFALGEGNEVASSVADLGPAPDEVAAGDVVVVPLVRGGRVLGALYLRSTDALERGQIGSLRAVAELLAATVANSRLFEREQESVRRLQELDEMKSAFLGTASHELRTPVTAIRGFSELLDRSWDDLGDDQRRDFVGRIARNSASLGALVQDLLDFARLGRGATRLQPVALSLSAAVTSVVEQVATFLDDHQLDLRVEPDVMVWADPAAVERITTNLVSNAAKYSPTGTVVTVTVDSDGERPRLVVDDEGPGVPPAERERIFSRFYRGGGQLAVQTRGAGIGLAVVSDLAEEIGATVTVGDSPAGGARFQVAFRPEPADPPTTDAGA